MKAIKACEYDDPIADELIRYAGTFCKVMTIGGFILLIKPSDGLIRPWLRMNLERLKFFGIDGEIVEITEIGNTIIG